MNEPWQFYRSVLDGEERSVNGLNIWDYPWKDLRRSVLVKDLVYGQDQVMGIYEIRDKEITVVFAAGEFSNLVWGFYLPA